MGMTLTSLLSNHLKLVVVTLVIEIFFLNLLHRYTELHHGENFYWQPCLQYYS